MIGEKFGRLTVVSRAPNRGHFIMWKCKCDCGNEIVTREVSLKSGVSKSCGCLQRDKVRMANTKHGHYKTRLYSIWNLVFATYVDASQKGQSRRERPKTASRPLQFPVC